MTTTDHGGKLTMELVHFMTNTCGWGLKLIDGCTLGSGLGLEMGKHRDFTGKTRGKTHGLRFDWG